MRKIDHRDIIIMTMAIMLVSVSFAGIHEYNMEDDAWNPHLEHEESLWMPVDLGWHLLHPMSPLPELDSLSPKWAHPDSLPDGQCMWHYKHGPNPFTFPVYVAECTTDFMLVIQPDSGAEADTLAVRNLAPGWYGIVSKTRFPEAFGTWQYISSGEVLYERYYH